MTGVAPSAVDTPASGSARPVTSELSPKLKELTDLLAEQRRRKTFKKFERYSNTYSPDYVHKDGSKDGYAKHRTALESKDSTITSMAANRVGKTQKGAWLVTAHATGDYPSWWKGKRHSEPTQIWVAGITTESTRDIIQLELMGDINSGLGTGMIPAEKIISYKRKQGSTDAVEMVYVRHVSGGISTIAFKSMEQGRSKFQGTAKHLIWLDEEPDREAYEIYSECNQRTMTTGGQVLLTFTPLKGMSDLVKFLIDKRNTPGYTFVNMTWDDAPHLDPAEKARRTAEMRPHEVEARTKGVPTIKEGLIYPFADSEIMVEPFPVPKHWPIVIGMDVGFTAPTAAILMARDPKSDVWYVINEYSREQADRADHAKAMKEWGRGVYIACDPSANRSESDGRKTMKVYKDFGLNINNAINDVENGIEAVREAFKSGHLKIFRTCGGVLEERRFYQFEKGKVRKRDDHLLDALRYGFMSRDKARTAAYFDAAWSKKMNGGTGGHTWEPADRTVGY